MAAITILSINPALTEGKDGINLLLCGLLCLSPLVLFLKGTRVIIPRIDVPLGLVCVFTIAFPLIFHPETLRWSTMLFTCAYSVFFMMAARLVKISGINASALYKTIRWIIYAYAIILIIQQLCVLFGMPVPLTSDTYPYYLPFKLNSLSSEPSHTSILLSVLMFYYGMVRQQKEKGISLLKEWKVNKWLWLAFFWALFSTLNSSAYIFGPLSLLPYIDRKNILWICSGMFLVVLLMFLMPSGFISHAHRIGESFEAISTLDEQKIIDSDPSIAFRVVPTLRAAKAIDPDHKDTYTGHGVDADRRDFEPPPAQLHKRGGSAGFFTMWYNFGPFCAFAYWTAILIVVLAPRKWQTYLISIVALYLSAEYNMQMIWQLMLLAVVYKKICDSGKLLST